MFLTKYMKEIEKLCKTYEIRNLFVFGSVLTDKFSKDSDIDLIVDIKTQDPINYAENYFNFKFSLEDLLNRNIDLLENRSLKNLYLRNHINKTKKVIYESKN